MLSSLRGRLISGTVVATLLIHVVAATLLYWAIRQSLVGEFDRALEARAQDLISITTLRREGITVNTEDDEFAQFAPGKADQGFVLLDQNSQVVAHADPPGAPEWWNNFGGTSGQSFGFQRLSTGAKVRFVNQWFKVRLDDDDFPSPRLPGPPAQLIVLGDVHQLFSELDRLSWLLAGGFGLSIVVSAAVLAWVIGRTLRPMDRLAAGIGGLGVANLSQRIILGRAPDEMRPVIERLNELLERLEASFARERAFTADVAHELRTPLAGLTTALEICASRPRESAQYLRTIQDCLGTSRSMRAMVENLLTLARADAGQVPARRQILELASAARTSWRSYENRAADRRLQVNWNLQDDLEIASDADLLGLVLSNLFDNAVSYADEGGRIDVDASANSHGANFRIANSGSHVAAADADRVFDRFWRGDAARGAGKHAGLGLALCRKIMSLLGGDISLETEKDHVFAVTLSWAPEQVAPQTVIPPPVPSASPPQPESLILSPPR
jgi:two-component system, OmpR family, heavy metal sensor histidine kinase CusS